jgi:pheromone a factor receptor
MLELRKHLPTILEPTFDQPNTAVRMSATTNPKSLSRPLSAILLPILATSACILCLPILVNHIKSRNLATSVLISWIVLENVYNLVNPLLWPTNDFGRWWDGVGLCDVESKLRLAGYMGYASALVCIYRQLALILNTEQIVLVPSPAQRRRRIAIEIALCFGAPIYIMLAHFIVQSGRYYVFAITGCVPILDSSWPSIVLVLIWPGIMWLVAAAYCSIIIHRLIKYRRHVSGILSGPHSRYNQSQFTRVFAMATALILIFLPLALYILVQNLSYNGVRNPYSWSRTHDWSNSTFFMPSSSGENFGRWIEVVTGFVVFVSLGLSRDGLLMYRRLLLKVGLGRIFPRLRFSYCQEVRGVLHSPEHTSLATKFGSMCSLARLIFHRRSHAGSPSA